MNSNTAVMESNDNNIIAFPKERIVREVSFEPLTSKENVDHANIDQFISIYVDVMCSVDSALQKHNCLAMNDEAIERSYILMQQSIVALIARHVNDTHVFHELADATIILGEEPEINMLGVVTDVDAEGYPECIMFSDEDDA